jgi:hypothetical protein
MATAGDFHMAIDTYTGLPTALGTKEVWKTR